MPQGIKPDEVRMPAIPLSRMNQTTPGYADVGGGFMRIPWELVVSFGIGLILLCLIGYLLLVPRRFMWRLVAGGVMGALALWAVNLLGALAGFHVEINPFTAMAVGFLGLPGAALVAALQLLL